MKRVDKLREHILGTVRLNVKTRQDAILLHLQTYGSINQYDAIDLYNVLTLPKTISNLKKAGHDIFTEQIEKVDYIGTYSFTEYHYKGFIIKN